MQNSILATIRQQNKFKFQLHSQSGCTSEIVVMYNLIIWILENDIVDETKLHTTKSLEKCNLLKLHLKLNFIQKLKRIFFVKNLQKLKYYIFWEKLNFKFSYYKDKLVLANKTSL